METNDEIINSVCPSCGMMFKIKEKGIPDGATYCVKCSKCNIGLMYIKNRTIVLDCPSCGNKQSTVVKGAPHGARCRIQCPKCKKGIMITIS